ncbi:MAG: lipase secretion chaperone [Pseudomonadota bacterium]
MNKRYLLTGVVVVVVLLMALRLGLYWMQGERGSVEARPPAEVIDSAYREAERAASDNAEKAVEGVPESERELDAEALYALAVEDLPPSLQGTQVDGGFRLDENGNLIVEPQVIRVFEYFMTTIGEESLDRIVQRVRRLIEAALPASAQDDAKLLLAQYLDYRERQAELLGSYSNSGDLATLREGFSQLKQVRRDVFGGEHARALFADKEAYTDYNLNSMALNQSQPGLDELERIERLRNMASTLPESRREQIRERLNQRELDHRTRALKEQGASAEELRQMRAQLVGVEAAERLAELDEERAAWEQRVSEFDSDLQEALDEAGSDITAEEEQRIIESTLQRHGFDEREALRVKATRGLL